jgi:hypothetical protein
VWSWIREWLAESLGATRRPRRLATRAFVGALAALGFVLGLRYGVGGVLPSALLLAVALGASRGVVHARAALWRAAFLSLSDPRQRPPPPAEGALLPPTAQVLRELAAAIDAARRDHPAHAADRLPRIDRALLRPEEARLLDAARAMVSLGLGDRSRAAQQAILALPTGSGEIDALLGRVVVAEAWRDPDRLAAIDRTFRDVGLGDGAGTTLSRLGRLVRLRVAPSDVEALAALGDEARALGDEAFASELHARARASTYR